MNGTDHHLPPGEWLLRIALDVYGTDPTHGLGCTCDECTGDDESTDHEPTAVADPTHGLGCGCLTCQGVDRVTDAEWFYTWADSAEPVTDCPDGHIWVTFGPVFSGAQMADLVADDDWEVGHAESTDDGERVRVLVGPAGDDAETHD